jgi:hypothetical protein
MFAELLRRNDSSVGFPQTGEHRRGCRWDVKVCTPFAAMSCIPSKNIRKAPRLRTSDLPPENWTSQTEDFLVISRAGRGETGHEDIEIQRAADRPDPEAG